MENYGVKDYGAFDSAIATTNKFNSSVAVVQESAKEASTKLGGGSIFKGPAADACSQVATSLSSTLDSSMSNYKTMNDFLNGVSTAYKNSDEESLKTLLMAGAGSGFKTEMKSSLKIPDDLAQRGYTVTGYGDKGVVYTDLSSVHWADGTNQRKIFDEWEKQGGKYKNGIAVMNVNGQECYLVATSEEAGKVGDNINIKLKNGESFPAVVADQKSRNDPNYTKYGHTGSGGTNVVEFEVDMHTFNEKGCNPNTKDWGLEWDSSSGVTEIENYGSIVE